MAERALPSLSEITAWPENTMNGALREEQEHGQQLLDSWSRQDVCEKTVFDSSLMVNNESHATGSTSVMGDVVTASFASMSPSSQAASSTSMPLSFEYETLLGPLLSSPDSLAAANTTTISSSSSSSSFSSSSSSSSMYSSSSMHSSPSSSSSPYSPSTHSSPSIHSPSSSSTHNYHNTNFDFSFLFPHELGVSERYMPLALRGTDQNLKPPLLMPVRLVEYNGDCGGRAALSRRRASERRAMEAGAAKLHESYTRMCRAQIEAARHVDIEGIHTAMLLLHADHATNNFVSLVAVPTIRAAITSWDRAIFDALLLVLVPKLLKQPPDSKVRLALATFAHDLASTALSVSSTCFPPPEEQLQQQQQQPTHFGPSATAEAAADLQNTQYNTAAAATAAATEGASAFCRDNGTATAVSDANAYASPPPTMDSAYISPSTAAATSARTAFEIGKRASTTHLMQTCRRWLALAECTPGALQLIVTYAADMATILNLLDETALVHAVSRAGCPSPFVMRLVRECHALLQVIETTAAATTSNNTTTGGDNFEANAGLYVGVGTGGRDYNRGGGGGCGSCSPSERAGAGEAVCEVTGPEAIIDWLESVATRGLALLNGLGCGRQRRRAGALIAGWSFCSTQLLRVAALRQDIPRSGLEALHMLTIWADEAMAFVVARKTAECV